MENYLKELITLRTDGLVDAMKSMKEIETLFDKVESGTCRTWKCRIA